MRDLLGNIDLMLVLSGCDIIGTKHVYAGT